MVSLYCLLYHNGALLFAIQINDVTSYINYLNILLYADHKKCHKAIKYVMTTFSYKKTFTLKKMADDYICLQEDLCFQKDCSINKEINLRH